MSDGCVPPLDHADGAHQVLSMRACLTSAVVMPSLCGRSLMRALVSTLLLLCLPFATASNGDLSVEDQARALLVRAKATNETDIHEAAAISRRALSLLRDSHDDVLKREIDAQLCATVSGFAPVDGVRMAEQGLRTARQSRDRKAIARYLGCKAYAQDVSGNISAASSAYDDAVRAAEPLGDQEIMANVLANRGENRQYLGRYDDALIDLNRAYDLYVAIGRVSGQRYTLNAIANLYSDPAVGEFDKAIEYYEQLMKGDQASGSKSAVATTLFNIASAYEEKSEFDAALRDFRRALEIDTLIADRDAIAEEERAIGRILTRQEKPQEALPYIDRAMHYFVETKDDDGVARTRLTRGIALSKLGRLDDSLRDLELARTHFESEGNLRFLAWIQQARADVFVARNDWKSAYQATNALRDAERKLDERVREARSSRLRVQFDAARKDEMNRALMIENAQRGAALDTAERMRALQRQVILLGAALLLLMAAIGLQQVYKIRRMRRLAMTDELTNLSNRRHILTFLDKQLESAVAAAGPLSVIAFDIDHFKRINDRCGHDGGDRALIAIADVARCNLRVGDRLGRTGGEEFLVVLPATRLDAAAAVAERLRQAIERMALERSDDSTRITSSFGVSEHAIGDDGVEVLLKRADDALYRAKHEGRNRVVLG